MKLEVGMYVRSKINGSIGKITDIENIELSNKIEVIRAGIRYILDNNYNRGFCDTEKDSVIASHNIIDLIEVGDIVVLINGLKKEELMLIKDLDKQKCILETHKIISIATKEQFESMSYKVEE